MSWIPILLMETIHALQSDEAGDGPTGLHHFYLLPSIKKISLGFYRLFRFRFGQARHVYHFRSYREKPWTSSCLFSSKSCVFCFVLPFSFVFWLGAGLAAIIFLFSLKFYFLAFSLPCFSSSSCSSFSFSSFFLILFWLQFIA